MLTDLIPSSTISGGSLGYSTGPTGGGGGYGGGSSSTRYYTFPHGYLVTSITYSFYAYAYEYGDDTGTVAYTASVGWFNGSIWQNIPGTYYIYSNGQYHGSQSCTLNTGTVNLTGLSLSNCQGISTYVYTQANNNKNNGTCNTNVICAITSHMCHEPCLFV